MSLIIKYSESKAIPEGIYVAQLTKLEPVVHPTWGDSIRWTFEITQGEHTNVSVTAMSSTKVSPKSKIFTWVQAFGERMTPGQEFDLEALIGREVQVRIINKKQSKTVDGKLLEMTFSNVDALAPYIPKKGETTAPPKEAAESVTDVPDVPAAFANIPPDDGLESDQDFDF